MHAKQFLHKLLTSSIHKTRAQILIVATNGLIQSKQLKLTSLGRSLGGSTKERSDIRRIDRLLGNLYYQENSIEIYKLIANSLLGTKQRPILLVDWSSIPNSNNTDTGEHCILRATLAAKGRSLTLYDEVHPKTDEGKRSVHNTFLDNLKSILPENCKPIIVSDSGFKNPWFKKVLSLGWDFVGRTRGITCYSNGKGFKPISTLHKQASYSPKALGEIILAKTNPMTLKGYIYKCKLKGRKHKTKSGKVSRNKDSRKHASAYREPWVLISSLSGKGMTNKVVKIYKLRMQIEENFRDMKSTKYGFSFNNNQTIKPKRYIVWLILSALASLLAWVVGYFSERQKLHYDFQANSYKSRRVLSLFYLGCQVLRKKIPINIQIDVLRLEAFEYAD